MCRPATCRRLHYSLCIVTCASRVPRRSLIIDQHAKERVRVLMNHIMNRHERIIILPVWLTSVSHHLTRLRSPFDDVRISRCILRVGQRVRNVDFEQTAARNSFESHLSQRETWATRCILFLLVLRPPLPASAFYCWVEMNAAAAAAVLIMATPPPCPVQTV